MILTGDIGGTKTLLAAHEDDGTIVARRRYASREAATFDALVARFLEETAARPRLACFGVAGPVLGLFSIVYGFILGLVAQRSNSILPAIICHFIIDLGCIGMPILRFHG